MSVPPIGNPVQEAAQYTGSGGITQQDIQNILNAPKGLPDIPSAFGNGGRGVPSSVIDMMKATPSSADAQKNAPDFGSVAKNIIDFLSTPLYMVTNTAYTGNPIEGIEKGWDAGINHNPENAKDWTDVAQKIESEHGIDPNTPFLKQATDAAGIAGDLVLDPLNFIPGAGIARGVLKGTGEAISAGREASRAGGRILDTATEEAAKAGRASEPVAATMPSGDAGLAADSLESGDAAGASAAPETAPAAPSAPPASGASASDKAVDTFSNMPEIKKALDNQQLGVLPAMAKAFGSAFTDSVKGSETGQIVSKLLEKFKEPVQVTPEASAAAHVESVINKDALKTEPVATITAPEAEVPNPEKDIAEKHFGESGHDTFKAIQDVIDNTNWTRPPDRNLAQLTNDHAVQTKAWGAAGLNMADAPSLEKYLADKGYKPKPDIDHPFKDGNIKDSQSYLRERATPEEQANAARAVGVSEHAPPAEISKAFFANKDKYLAAEKDINDLYKRESDTPLKEAKDAAQKQQDIRNSATVNTLTRGIYDEASPEQLEATRKAKARDSFMSIKDENVPLYGAPKGTPQVSTVSAAQQRHIIRMGYQDALKHQAQEAPEIGKKGYRGNTARMKGASAKEAGGISHPLLFRTPANQRLWATIIGHVNSIKADGFPISLFPKKGVAEFDKGHLVTKLFRTAMDQLQAMGMSPVLDLAVKEGEKEIHLSQADILEAIMTKSEGLDTRSVLSSKDIRNHLIGSGKKAPVEAQAFISAFEALLHERDAIHTAMEKAGGALKPEEMEDLLTKAEQRVSDTLNGKSSAYRKEMTKDQLANILAVRSRGVENLGEKEYGKQIDDLAKKIVRDPHIGVMLEQRHLYNEAVHAADIKKYKENSWSDIKSSLEDKAKTDWTAKKLVAYLNENIEGAKDFLPYTDRAEYTDDINKLKEEVVAPEEEKAANAKDASSTLSDSEKTAKEVLAVKDATDPEYIPDPLDIQLGKIATDTMRAMHPVRFFFDAKFPFLGSAFYTAVLEGNHSRARTQMGMDQLLKQHIMKNNGEDQLLKDFQAVQRGGDLEGSAQELNKIIGVHFAPDSRFSELLKSNKLTMGYTKALLESKGILDKIDPKWLDTVKKPADLIEFWKHVPLKDTTDAADFLSRVHSVMTQAYTDNAIARDFEKRFGTTDINKVKAGTHAKLTWNEGSRGYSTKVVRNKGYNTERARAERKPGLWDLLDKNKYYDRVAAKEIPAIHRVMNESRSLGDDNALKRFVNNVYDPWTQLIKSFQTTFRPGHWVSNLMGDSIRMHLAGVRPQDIAPALKVLRAGAKDEGFANDIPAKFQRLTDEANRKFSTKLPDKDTYFFTTINGKKTAVSHTEAARRFETNGTTVSGSHGQHEDLLNREDMDTSSLGKFAKGVNSGLNKVMNIGESKGISIARMQALRDNLTRTPIAMKVLQSGNFKSLDDAFEKAFAEVRKWAPTSMDFTREESMYARRALLYYTWLRGMLPNVVETLMERPGAFLAPNKVLYGIAKANGVDPASIGDPFPTDQKFPAYYFQNVIGPQIKVDGNQLWGFSPMAPTIDILDQLTGNINTHNQKLGAGNQTMAIGENLVGMLNPLFKMPIELATGQSGGIPIKDPVQYAQDELAPPQLDLISKMSGKDINGENRTDNPNGATDLLNFLSGMHWTQYNSPTAERAVAGEQKAEKSAMRADAKRAAK